MLTSKEIQAKMDDGVDRIDAILAVAKEEDRELTPEETAAVNAFHGEGDDPGEYGKLQSELAQAKKIEARKKEIAASRLTPKLNAQIDGIENPTKVVVPAKAKRSRPGAFSKVFTNKDEANEKAYISGQLLLATVFGNERAQDWVDNHGLSDIRAAMSEGTNSAGGFTVDDELEAVIITIAEENGVLRRFARPTGMTSDTKDVPVRTAGLTVYYPAENASITPSDLTLTRAQLIAKKYATLTEVSSELNEDSVVDIANEIAMNAGLALALAEDTNGFIGDGTATYASVSGLDDALNANSIQTAAAANISWATLDLADFEATAAKLPRFTGAQPAWFIHSAGYFNAMVRLMNASGGTPGSEVASGYNASFLGYPVVFTQVLPNAPGISTNVCFFGDLSQSVYMGNRRGVTIAADMGGKYFEKDQMAVKVTERVAITVENQDGSAAGPVVALATPGA